MTQRLPLMTASPRRAACALFALLLAAGCGVDTPPTDDPSADTDQNDDEQMDGIEATGGNHLLPAPSTGSGGAVEPCDYCGIAGAGSTVGFGGSDPGAPDFEEKYARWEAKIGDQCEPQEAVAPPVQDPEQECRFLKPVFRGSFDYTWEPGQVFEAEGQSFSFISCDMSRERCDGPHNYEVKVEYVSELEWLIEIRRSDTSCNYEHRVEALSDDGAPFGFAVRWKNSHPLRLRLRPIESGYEVASLKDQWGTALRSSEFVGMASPSYGPWHAGPEELGAGFLQHLKSHTWQCVHPPLEELPSPL